MTLIMKYFILISVVLGTTLYGASCETLPEVLIERARDLIYVAEHELHKHHNEGRHQLTKALELEIEEVRKLEHELMALDQHKHLETHHAHQIEERLLKHENRLMEELVRIINLNAKEREDKEHLKQ